MEATSHHLDIPKKSKLIPDPELFLPFLQKFVKLVEPIFDDPFELEIMLYIV